MEVHSACIAQEYGWVEIDKSLKKAINCVSKKLHDDILQSQFYKIKENIYWPKVKIINNYISKQKNKK